MRRRPLLELPNQLGGLRVKRLLASGRARMAALRLAKKDKGVDMPLPDSEDDEDW